MKLHKKRFSSLIVLFLLLRVAFLNISCSNADTQAQNQTAQPSQILKTISAIESKEMIKNFKTNERFVLLDIRTPREFNYERIDGAINIDFYQQDFVTNLQNLDKEKTYLIYCRTANRTSHALRLMKDLGFREVYNMAGGIVDWKRKGFAVINNN